MIRKVSSEVIEKFIAKYGMNEIFSKDMRPYMELLSYRKNEFICREGETLDFLYFIVEGKAKVFTTVSNGKALLLCFYHSFKVLGDIEIIEDKAATTNIQVLEDTYCIGISRENVSAHLTDDPKFLRYICNSLGQKLTRCTKNSAINLLYSLENRLAGYMAATCETIHVDGARVLVFNENLTELSELLGTSYRHLHRTLTGLCDKNVVRKKENGYEIINIKEISRLAADLYN